MNQIPYQFQLLFEDFRAPSLDQDEAASTGKADKTKKDDYDNDVEDDDDESFPLLKETDFGGTAVAKALRRQCRYFLYVLS